MKNDLPLCPLCSTPVKRVFQLKHAETLRCLASGCGLEFAWPQSDDETLARAYTELYYPNGNGAVHLENTTEEDSDILLNHIEAHCLSLRGCQLLDYGCGRGSLLKAALRRGVHATGIEPDAVARRTAHELTGAEIYSDIASLAKAKPETRFDCVVVCTVIEHLREPWTELARLKGTMNSQGVMAVTTANSSCLRSRLLRGSWEQRTNPTHFYYLNETSQEAVLRQAGFGSVWRLPPIITYSNHRWYRQSIQRALAVFGLQGGIIHAASPSASPHEGRV